MDEWLAAARDLVARRAGVPPERLELDDEAVVTLLDLARVAAHESGERTNAPLLCYLVGLAARDGAPLGELADAVLRAPP
ncbi:MAG: hypothetical protein H0V40_01240 [Actinobacteria bacterium]|nr:hypothetical protein [Actinomycetota bacterium]